MVILRNHRKGDDMTEPVTGIMCNVSEAGGCLELPTPLASGHHLFYRTLRSRTTCLVIEGAEIIGDRPEFSVQATSLWMRGPEPGGPSGFRIGIRFKNRQKDLFRQVVKKVYRADIEQSNTPDTAS